MLIGDTSNKATILVNNSKELTAVIMGYISNTTFQRGKLYYKLSKTDKRCTIL